MDIVEVDWRWEDTDGVVLRPSFGGGEAAFYETDDDGNLVRVAWYRFPADLEIAQARAVAAEDLEP